jgi:hypothetical protein
VPRVGTHSMGSASGSVSQRNGGVGGNLTFSTYAPPSLRGYVRIPIELTFLKPEAARSLFPRLIDRNNDFWCLLSQADLTPAKNFDKAHNIDRLCASERRLLAPMVWETRNRVCIVKNVDVKEGAIFSIEERQLTECGR